MPNLQREALIELIYRNIATEHEIERVRGVHAKGGITRILRAQRGRTVNVHEMADQILALFKSNPSAIPGETSV